MPEEDLELPVHCIIQCHSFPSTVLYSARGGSGASRPLYYTVPEEDPELPVHCIIQCQRRIWSFPSTVLYPRRIRSFPSTLYCRGGPELPAIIQCQRGSGASRPQYYTVPEESEATHKLIQSQAPDPASSRMPA